MKNWVFILLFLCVGMVAGCKKDEGKIEYTASDGRHLEGDWTLTEYHGDIWDGIDHYYGKYYTESLTGNKLIVNIKDTERKS